jgi:hypothetical protein
MLGTVRTSHTLCLSAERIDDPPCERKREDLDELPLVLDEDLLMMRRERGHDVLPFQFSADEVIGAVKLDPAVAIDLTNPRHMTLGDGKCEMTAGIHVGLERELVREMAEGRPETFAKDSGEPGSVFGQREASAGLLAVVVAKEAVTRPAQRPQIGADVKKDALLPEAVEALHGGVSTRLSRRDEKKVDAQQEMKPHDLGETVTIPAPSGCGHLVVHLGDLRQAHNTPGINKMAAERDGLFIGELTGRGGLSDDIDGVKGIEPGDAAQSPQVPRPDQVGLLEVTHPTRLDAGIRRTTGQSADLDLFRLTGPGQDLFDGRDSGKPTEAPSLELEMDRFGADASESRPAALMGGQFIAEGQDLTNERPAGLVPDMFGYSASITKSGKTEGSIAAVPLGQPKSSSLDFAENLSKTHSILKKSDRPDPTLILAVAPHRPTLLPCRMGKSLGDATLVCDVLTVF